MTIEEIARLCHEVNRGYCEYLGDTSQKPWEEAEEWQRASAVQGVLALRAQPDLTPTDLHNAWMTEKVRDGWTFGPVKDPAHKLHPCLRPYHELPPEQRLKDTLFSSVVRACLPELLETEGA